MRSKSRSAAIRALVQTHVRALLIQLQHCAACNALHPVEARLARWLLHFRDRIDHDVRAMLAAQSPERRFGHPRHRCENDRNLVIDRVREAHDRNLSGLLKSCNVKI